MPEGPDVLTASDFESSNEEGKAIKELTEFLKSDSGKKIIMKIINSISGSQGGNGKVQPQKQYNPPKEDNPMESNPAMNPSIPNDISGDLLDNADEKFDMMMDFLDTYPDDMTLKKFKKELKEQKEDLEGII